MPPRNLDTQPLHSPKKKLFARKTSGYGPLNKQVTPFPTPSGTRIGVLMSRSPVAQGVIQGSCKHIPHSEMIGHILCTRTSQSIPTIHDSNPRQKTYQGKCKFIYTFEDCTILEQHSLTHLVLTIHGWKRWSAPMPRHKASIKAMK